MPVVVVRRESPDQRMVAFILDAQRFGQMPWWSGPTAPGHVHVSAWDHSTARRWALGARGMDAPALVRCVREARDLLGRDA